jgi:AcrR family transcriptional regulator
MSVPKTVRKRFPASQRRGQVLEVAAEVFANKGYRMASVTDIVEGAGIGRGTFYLYFNSKKDVFLELTEGYFSGFAHMLSENQKRLEEATRKGVHFIPVWRDNMAGKLLLEGFNLLRCHGLIWPCNLPGCYKHRDGGERLRHHGARGNG